MVQLIRSERVCGIEVVVVPLRRVLNTDVVALSHFPYYQTLTVCE